MTHRISLWIPGRKPLVDVKSLPDRVSTGRGKEGKPMSIADRRSTPPFS
jgi:hypothetical protein